MQNRIDALEGLIGDPRTGLPEEVFLFLTRTTPMVNVDLLIKNGMNQTLLTWRDDGYYPPGWHVPGGIVRYKEKMADRVRAVAASELGADVCFKEYPLAINEVIHPSRRNRGHFISFLFECALVSAPDEALKYAAGAPKRGEWAWHSQCPDNIIPVHEMYREHM